MYEKLTEEQIENWRDILSVHFGSYARILSDEDIEELRERFQIAANRMGDEVNE